MTKKELIIEYLQDVFGDESRTANEIHSDLIDIQEELEMLIAATSSEYDEEEQ